jgi:hypothetical protein
MTLLRTIGRNMLFGAAAGGAIGGLSDNGSFLGGAMSGGLLAGGATYGAAYARGRYINKRISKMMGVPEPIKRSFGEKIGVARFARKAIGAGMRVARAGARAGARGYYSGPGSIGGYIGGPLFRGSMAAGAGLSRANRFIGNNVAAVNKYGGYAAGALGVASAGYIGSSVLSSNRSR